LPAPQSENQRIHEKVPTAHRKQREGGSEGKQDDKGVADDGFGQEDVKPARTLRSGCMSLRHSRADVGWNGLVKSHAPHAQTTWAVFSD
jgi:hypothetical protein